MKATMIARAEATHAQLTNTPTYNARRAALVARMVARSNATAAALAR